MGKDNRKAKWTVMVYMAGDNNLDTAALRDIAEMARVGSSDNINILVQLDRANDFLTRRFFITKGGGYRKDCVETLEETNTGDPKVLENFMLWAMEKYPANRYFLILWNHGGGWWEDPRRSIAYDDSSYGDALDNGELKTALSSITKKLVGDPARGGRPIDILGMDACLMNMVEVAYQLKDCVYVIVGSEEEEPFDGWPYDKVLQVLKNRPVRHPKTMGKEIVREYIKSYRGKGDEVTQSALNLRKIDDVVRNLDCLSHELVRSINDDKVFAAIASSWKDSPKFFYDNYIDLYRFTRLLKGRCRHRRIKEKAYELIRSLRPGRKKAILYQRHLGRRMRHTHGMSIYFPKKHINPRYRELDFYQDCHWGEFLEKYLNRDRGPGI
ncbi:MAG: hypothetical protein JRH06_17680 [Deltaproteobacteria bacterium]|nr:hypothetical protein [Deltaproteobacteria bacterium]